MFILKGPKISLWAYYGGGILIASNNKEYIKKIKE